jgi:glycosyltransferase involved in cell wall biosynthesis
MEEIVTAGRTGLTFRPGDSADLAAKVDWAWSHPKEMWAMGMEARRVYEARYTSDRNYSQLMDVYESAVKPGSAPAQSVQVAHPATQQ